MTAQAAPLWRFGRSCVHAGILLWASRRYKASLWPKRHCRVSGGVCGGSVVIASGPQGELAAFDLHEPRLLALLLNLTRAEDEGLRREVGTTGLQRDDRVRARLLPLDRKLILCLTNNAISSHVYHCLLLFSIPSFRHHIPHSTSPACHSKHCYQEEPCRPSATRPTHRSRTSSLRC